MTRTTARLDVRTALKEAVVRLREARVPSHTLAAELLLMHVLGRERVWLYAYPEEALDAGAVARYFELVERRIAGTPTQYLTGRQEFWGLEFEVTPDVLIPRPETEHVVEVALERLGPPKWEEELRGAPGGNRLRIADVGTGSGCLAVALARELPGAQVFATDVSARALEVARRNAARHAVAPRVHFVQCNLLDALECGGSTPLSDSARAQPFGLKGPQDKQAAPLQGGDGHHSPLATRHSALFHLIVSNPPYVARSEADALPREVREHEPAAALFAGEHGAEIYEPLVRQAAELLAPGGILVLELGYNSLARVRSLLESAEWSRVGVTNDLAGIPRVIAAAPLLRK